MMNSSSVHNENLPNNNTSRNNEGKNSKNDKMQKFAKFNNSRLFKDKVGTEPAPMSNRITPFRMEVSGKESAFSNQDLKDSVLSKPFPFLAKGNQETPRNQTQQEYLNYSSIELVTSQMGRRVSTEANVLNFSTLEPMNNHRSSLENSILLTSGRKSLRMGCPDSITKTVTFADTKIEEINNINTQLPPPSFETAQEDFVKPGENVAESTYVEEKRREKSIGLPFVLSILLVILISAFAFSYQQKNSFGAVENMITKIKDITTPTQQVMIHDEKLIAKDKYLNVKIS